MQIPLMTSRLRLVPLRKTDLDRLITLLSEPGVCRYLCDGEILPPDAVVTLIDRSLELASTGLGLWSIEKECSLWLGCVGLYPASEAAMAARPDFVGEVEPVIALHEWAWGEGYAAEALDTVLAHAFGSLRLSRLVALVDEPNTRFHALMERTGFRMIGVGTRPRYTLRAYENRFQSG
jgi:[ribosomal protein S5]-alanine N-acetyltransferase